MAQLTARWLTATKNADGTVTLEIAFGNYPLSTNRFVLTLTAAEATALSNTIAGVTGTTNTVTHTKETATPGNYDH
jgi:hypothetical protein